MATFYPFSKKMVFAAILLLAMLQASDVVLAQRSSDTLKEIIIAVPKVEPRQDLRQGFTAGQSTLIFDSTLRTFYKTLSLSDLVMEQSPVFVKTYGVNSLSTLGIRGASAAQSAVLWNGVPINNAAVGVADVSLLNGGLFQDVSLQYGGSSALFGSGNVGGALLLDDGAPGFTRHRAVSLSLGGGSFGSQNALLSADWQNGRWHIGLKTFYQGAKNNFPYENDLGQTLEMPNAALSGAGGIMNVDYLWPQGKSSKVKRQVLSFKTWCQQYKREIPPALFETSSVKKQTDRSWRSLLSWKQERKRSVYYAKLSFNKDDLRYRDGIVLPDNENGVRQWYAEMGAQWQINNPLNNPYWQHKLLVFAPVLYASACGGNLDKTENQCRPAVAGSYQLQSNDDRYHLNVALRQEWWTNRQQAFLPGMNAKLKAFNIKGDQHNLSFSILANVQRSFRVPNLNELYFSPGGNPGLKPEQGWNESGGIAVRLDLAGRADNTGHDTWMFSNKSTYFNRDIRNWIYWLGGAIWTPHNLAEVHSRGVETESKITWHHRRAALSLGLKTAYVLATTTRSYLPGDGSIGKQIPYTPRYNGTLDLGIIWKRLLLNYNHRYTGYRFVTTDESQYLKPFQTGNLQMAYTVPLADYSLSVSAQVRNIWNSRYEIVNGRPMPGRNFLVGLQLSWGK
ncbi:MAG TPA: TonB-dependent receptor [Edaphocola sp.]|nr:TonB-dependent receptor [Edaphocola sp.]